MMRPAVRSCRLLRLVYTVASSAVVLSFTPTVHRRATTTQLRVSIGLGPEKEQQEEEDQTAAVVDYEVPNHEEYRTSRRSTMDESCDAWFGHLLEKVPAGTLERLHETTQTVLTTPVPLVNEEEVADTTDEHWTPYVSTRLPWTPLVPAYGLEEYGLPVPRRNAESWRHFDVAGLVAHDYHQSSSAATTIVQADELKEDLRAMGGWLDDDACEARLVYVNGHFVDDLSKQTKHVFHSDTGDDLSDPLQKYLERLPDGFTDTLAAPVPNGERTETSYKELSFPNHNMGEATSQFAVNAQQGTACFAALNNLKAQGVAVVDCPDKHNSDTDKEGDLAPILIVNAISNDNDVEGGTSVHPRSLIVVGEDSRVNVVQQCVDLPSREEQHQPTLYNGYTQVFVHARTNLTHAYIDETGGTVTRGVEVTDDTAVRQAEASRPALSDTHMEAIDVHVVGEEGVYEGTVLSIGGSGRVRVGHSLTLLQSGTHGTVNGFTLSGGLQRSDVKTNIHHIAQGTTSNQVQKNMIGGRATGAFRGRIRVEQSAQQTDSSQLSRTVLLSDKAQAWAVPSLEIIADDVQCAHGATVSDLSVEELFYLRSRGLDRTMARNLLMYAFAGDVSRCIHPSIMGSMEEAGLQQRIIQRLENLVPMGDRLLQGEFQSV